MADYQKYIYTPGTQPTLRIPPNLVLDDPDPPDPDAEDGDELFGNEGDETAVPEDDGEQLTLEMSRLLYCNRNPRTPCPICKPYIGTIWQHGCQPRLPRHNGCMCYYQEIYLYETKNKNRFPKAPLNAPRLDPKLL